jgi:hypothetical protein
LTIFQEPLANDIPKYKNQLANTDLLEEKLVIKEKIQTNYAMAEVYFQTLNVVTVSQKPMMDVC